MTETVEQPRKRTAEMPVRYDKITWGEKEWVKPVYFCRCGAFGHFSETIGKRREWYCGWDREKRRPVCKAAKQEGLRE